MATIDETQAAGFSSLRGQKYINLTTFRKSGQPVVTPVWFAEEGDRLYVMTGRNAGKIKRVRNNSQVLVGLSDARGRPRGPTIKGTARILPATNGVRVEQLLDRKYGVTKRLFELMERLLGAIRRRDGSRDYLEIVPA